MTRTTIDIDFPSTALVLIDLQNGMVALPLAPRSGEQVVSSARALADRFRATRSPVVLTTVAYPAAESGTAPDVVMPVPEIMPAGWDVEHEGLGAHPDDIHLTKQAWGAFVGTGLDATLRSRGVRTIVVGGIATNFGVESTAREAVALGYDVVVAADATASISPDHQDFSTRQILPMLARVRTTADIVG